MDVKVGRNDAGWEVSVFNVKLTDKGKELFGLEDLVRIQSFSSSTIFIANV